MISISHPRGDPRDTRTWSGTPANIVRALESHYGAVHAVNLDPTLTQKVLGLTRSLLTAHGRAFRRCRAPREQAFQRLERAMATAGSAKALHMTTLSLPGESRHPEFEHFVYIDSTYTLQRSQRPGVESPRTELRFEELERQALRQARHVFTVSEHVRDSVITDYGVNPASVTVAGTGRGRISPYSGHKVYGEGPILFVAKERFAEKGGLLLLDAFRIARQRRPDLRLIMVAPPEFRSAVEATSGAEFKTALPWAELEALFHSASLFAMPALYEPWGLVFLEALAARCPILGLRRNAFPEISGHGRFGFQVDDATPESVAAGLCDAFASPNRLQQMAEEGQAECLARHTWERTADAIARVILPDTLRRSSAASEERLGLLQQ